MSKDRERDRRHFAAGLGAILAAILATPAMAGGGRAETRIDVPASVEITPAVGTGIAFNIITQSLSDVFLPADPVDVVSLLRSPYANTPPRVRKVVGEVLILSTGAYGLDDTGDVPPPDNQGGGNVQPARFGSANGRFLYLAQFN